MASNPGDRVKDSLVTVEWHLTVADVQPQGVGVIDVYRV